VLARDPVFARALWGRLEDIARSNAVAVTPVRMDSVSRASP
jgi:hypothetical protein